MLPGYITRLDITVHVDCIVREVIGSVREFRAPTNNNNNNNNNNNKSRLKNNITLNIFFFLSPSPFSTQNFLSGKY